MPIDARKLRVVLPGGSGQVGTIAARHFHAAGHDVVVIARTRSEMAPWRTVQWDGVTLGEWAREIDAADIVINLAGRSVNCRYSAANRREIKQSRVGITRLVGEAIARSSRPPRLWMNASTATIYRHALDGPMDEATGELGGNEPDAPDTWRFSIDVAKSWEEVFFASPSPGTRKIALRSALTLSPDRGGIFDTLLSLVRHGVGGTRALDYLVAHDDIDGVVNIASPNPLPNKEFMAALREAWGTKIGLPATAWMLEIGAVFLRTETELVVKSRRVIPGRLLAHGFRFNFPEWPAAARDLVARWRQQVA